MAAAAPWVTVSEVRHVMVHGLDRPGWFDPDAIDDTEVAQAIANAQAEVTVKVAARYTVSSPSVAPEVLRNVVIDIAFYLLALQQHVGVLDEDDVIVLRYRRAVELVDGIAAGKYSLPADDDGDGTSATGAGAKVINPYCGQLFGMEDLGLGHRDRSSRGGWWPS